MNILDGKLVSLAIKNDIKSQVVNLIEQDIHPHLVAILVGNDPSSETYVAAKEKACKEVGILFTLYKLEKNISEEKLLETINFINNDTDVHGLIVQLPLPKHISEDKIINAISYTKDVDGFHPVNVGRMSLDLPAYLPATPYGIIEILRYYNIETEGKHCVVIGRSHIVGMPISIMMSKKKHPGNATVTLCHSKTENLKAITLQADILIVAIGNPLFITADMVKQDAVVIDVGIHRISDKTKKSGFKLVGDVDYAEVSKKYLI